MGRALPVYRVRATNTASESENKIHDDRVAAAYGFRGGLVPGVVVYGYMLAPVVGSAPQWLDHGSMRLKLIEPFYDAEAVVVRAEVDDDESLRVSAERENGAVCATGVALIRSKSLPLSPLPEHPLPKSEDRPAPSRENLIAGALLGTVREKLDLTGGRSQPERVLQFSNEILARNFRLGPWIHAASEIENWSAARDGEEISARARIQDRYDRKGHEFVVLDVTLVGSGGKLIQTVRHTAIYKPRFQT